MSNFLPIIFSISLLLAIVALLLIFSPEKPKIDTCLMSDIKKSKEKINSLLAREDIDLAKQALIEADKILDKVLKVKIRGKKDMGARLKFANKIISDKDLYQQIWEAHKLRNQIVHEVDTKVTFKEIKRAVSILNQARESLGY